MESREVLEEVKPFLRFFYWCGQCPWSIHYDLLKTEEKYNWIKINVPSTWWMALYIVLIIIGETFKKFIGSFKGSENQLIVQLYFVTELSLCAIMSIQPILYHDVIGEILVNLADIGHSLPSAMNYLNGLKILLRKIRRKFYLITLVFGICFALHVFMLVTDFKDSLVDFILFLLQLVNVIGSALAILFIDLLNYHLYQLKEIIECQSNGKAFDEQDCLKSVKILHFKLWETTQKVNLYFGWGLGLIFIRNFMDASFIMYWIFVIVSDSIGDPIIPLMRT